MFRFLIVWSVAILATFLQTYYQRIPEHKPPLRAEVYVNNHLYQVDLIQSSDASRDAEIKLAIKNKSVSARVFFRCFNTKDEWVYSDLYRDEDYLIGSIPLILPSRKTEYFFEFTENAEIVSVCRNHPVVLSFEGRVPRLALGCYFAFVFFSLLSSNMSGLSLATEKLSHRCYSTFAISSFLLLALVLSPLVQFYSSAAKSLNFMSFAKLIDMKFLFWGFVWLFVSVFERKKNKPTLIALTSTILFVLDVIPRCFTD